MNKMKCEEVKKSIKKQYTSLFKAIVFATLIVFSGLFILFPNQDGFVFSSIITFFFMTFSTTIWGMFFLSDIVHTNREHQFYLRNKQA